MYPGTSGKTHGDRNEMSPARKTQKAKAAIESLDLAQRCCDFDYTKYVGPHALTGSELAGFLHLLPACNEGRGNHEPPAPPFL